MCIYKLENAKPMNVKTNNAKTEQCNTDKSKNKEVQILRNAQQVNAQSADCIYFEMQNVINPNL